LTEGEALALCAGLSVTALPLASPDREGRLPAVAYRFDGAQRSLLYLPRGDPFSDLHAAVAAWCPSIDVALLDGSSVRFDGEARRDWTIDSFLGEIDALRAGGDGRMVVFFTRLSVRNPFHHPAGALRERLRAHRADLAQDGTQFWL
jgi:hypothetical protein